MALSLAHELLACIILIHFFWQNPVELVTMSSKFMCRTGILDRLDELTVRSADAVVSTLNLLYYSGFRAQ
jgi:hypothetical protein